MFELPVMAEAMALVVSGLAGVLAGCAYQGLQRVAHSERVRTVIGRCQSTLRIPHAFLELALAVVALPLIVAPFAFVLTIPRWLAATGFASAPFILLAAPIVALLALGVTMRLLREGPP